jgi:hypothetical protein
MPEALSLPIGPWMLHRAGVRPSAAGVSSRRCSPPGTVRGGDADDESVIEPVKTAGDWWPSESGEPPAVEVVVGGSLSTRRGLFELRAALPRVCDSRRSGGAGDKAEPSV